MTLDELRSGFFGYQKASVYRYITSLEEQFSFKLVEKDAAAKRAAEQYQEKINQLEQELQAVREQCETQKNEQMVIAHTLLDAQRYAEPFIGFGIYIHRNCAAEDQCVDDATVHISRKYDFISPLECGQHHSLYSRGRTVDHKKRMSRAECIRSQLFSLQDDGRRVTEVVERLHGIDVDRYAFFA